ncbi:TRAM/LAG1/CLN8 homology domain-containing protein [Gorgonomyces haynaldii]|nr:TRAM/LAG1/CLN8 homology domain-containing protein [Gorgonomyces haynaldii]
MKKGSNKAAVKNERIKFVTAAWKFTTYGLMASLGLYVLHDKEWSLSQRDYFQGWPNHPMSLDERFYYLTSFASYSFGFLTLFWEQEQSLLDLFVMIGHHIATLTLIGASYLYSFHRFGMVILLLHDVSDPFMELAKMFLYSGYNRIADVLFVTFAAVFISSRNIFYPFFVLPSIYKYCRYPDGRLFPSDNFNIWVFQAPLWFLEVLHIYWSCLILKMIYKAIVEKGVKDDIRNKKVD